MDVLAHIQEAARKQARERLKGHKGILASLTKEQRECLRTWDEPSVLVGKVPAKPQEQ